MSTSKHIDKICCIILIATLTLTLLFMNAGRFGVQAVSASVSAAGYVSRIFNPSKVHTVDIMMDDWDTFIENCTDEEYAACAVIIDGEAYRNVAIRAKGNTSLSSVEAYGNGRYSFKIEFDHYDDALTYYGLDKLCLNNIIQDNTYMKDFLTYRLMYEFGVDAPLCSYTYITVNGEDWGLYLAVEGIEEAFLTRNYGNNYGQLYKPDSTGMGGGRGNGRRFNMEDFDPENPDSGHSDTDNIPFNDHRSNSEAPHPVSSGTEPDSDPETAQDNDQDTAMPREPEARPDFKPMPDNGSTSDGMPGNRTVPGFDSSSGKGMKGSDVSLIYTDGEFESYSNIFDNVKTNLSDADKTRLIESLRKLNNTEHIGLPFPGYPDVEQWGVRFHGYSGGDIRFQEVLEREDYDLEQDFDLWWDSGVPFSKLGGWCEPEHIPPGCRFVGQFSDEQPFYLGTQYKLCLFLTPEGTVITDCVQM